MFYFPALASKLASLKNKTSHELLWLVCYCRDDKIRTCDPTPPRRVRYRAAPLPEFRKCKFKVDSSERSCLVREIFLNTELFVCLWLVREESQLVFATCENWWKPVNLFYICRERLLLRMGVY